MEFIRIGREYIATSEVHGLEAGADGLSCKLHYGNAHKAIHGEDAVDLIAWAEARLWNATSKPATHVQIKANPSAVPAAHAEPVVSHVEAKTPVPDAKKAK